jgi:uncharacterized protein (UPF0548 family)
LAALATVVSVIGVTRDPGEFVDNVVRCAAGHTVTYHEAGATRGDVLPTGYRHLQVAVHIGDGEVAWKRARQAIRVWAAHTHAGIKVTPFDAPIIEATTVVASRSFGPVVIAAPCRIVYTTDETTRFGFAYGTLPGHPEMGEESFHVVRDDRGVKAEIVAFSRPGDRLTKVAGPVAGMIQRAATRRYLAGIRLYVADRND